MDEYIRVSQKKERLVIGVMSGTSLDGIDIALVRIKGSGSDVQINLEEFTTYPMPDHWRTRIQAAFVANTEEICKLHYDLGHFFGDLILSFIESTDYTPSQIDLIGIHGQTVFHVDRHSTLQLGESAIIAVRTNTLVVSDFRSSDIAAGGSGAPLVPFLDNVLYRDPDHNVAIQNIGGIGNVTYLPRESNKAIIAFDTGPGNAILNELTELITDRVKSYDKDGTFAQQGELNQELLRLMMTHEYLSKAPPKSTGREVFGREYIQSLRHTYTSIPLLDLLRTSVTFIGETIAQSYERFLPDVERVFICGGGAKNPVLMTALKNRLSQLTVSELEAKGGIGAESKEAVAFALFAHERLNNVPTNVPSVTGAREEIALGKITVP